MSSLFDPCAAGALRLSTRIVMAPLTRNRAPGALANARMATYYRQRANPSTGAGLIITEATAISHQGQGYADVPGIWSPEQVAAWNRSHNDGNILSIGQRTVSESEALAIVRTWLTTEFEGSAPKYLLDQAVGDSTAELVTTGHNGIETLSALARRFPALDSELRRAFKSYV